MTKRWTALEESTVSGLPLKLTSRVYDKASKGEQDVYRSVLITQDVIYFGRSSELEDLRFNLVMYVCGKYKCK